MLGPPNEVWYSYVYEIDKYQYPYILNIVYNLKELYMPGQPNDVVYEV
jgi:hypothetical protein